MLNKIIPAYMGNKTRLVARNPEIFTQPLENETTVIEPYAGTAAFASHFVDRWDKVFLAETNPLLKAVWNFAIDGCSQQQHRLYKEKLRQIAVYFSPTFYHWETEIRKRWIQFREELSDDFISNPLDNPSPEDVARAVFYFNCARSGLYRTGLHRELKKTVINVPTAPDKIDLFNCRESDGFYDIHNCFMDFDADIHLYDNARALVESRNLYTSIEGNAIAFVDPPYCSGGIMYGADTTSRSGYIPESLEVVRSLASCPRITTIYYCNYMSLDIVFMLATIASDYGFKIETHDFGTMNGCNRTTGTTKKTTDRQYVWKLSHEEKKE